MTRAAGSMQHWSLTAAMLLGCIGGAVCHGGTIDEYTNATAWTSISGATVVGTETFNAYFGFLPSPVTGTTGSLGGGVVWSGTANGGLYADNVGGTRAFSTNASNTLDFNYTYGPGLSGVGGFFYPTDIDFNVIPATMRITVSLADTTSQTFTRAIATSNEFWGFHSPDSPITSISITHTSTATLYPAVSNMSLMTGGAAPIPEIDPTGFASCLSLVVGSLAALERRSRRR
ncbi:MAG: hypothetical protein ACKOCW_05815 [Planctomycetaceae bacterium]